MNFESKLRHVYDFPKEGIDFIDITTLLNDAKAFKAAIDEIGKVVKESGANVVVGTEARGFILGAAAAYKEGLRFVPVRKKGKLPYKTISGSYDLEYGQDTLEMHIDALSEGDKAIIVDDLLATGGTVGCVVDMIKELKAEVTEAVFLVNLTELPGEKVLTEKGIKVNSIVKF